MYSKEEKAKKVTKEIAKGKKKSKKKTDKKKSIFDELKMPAAPGKWDGDLGG